jgi:uncharacterized phage protein (TIGR01671 family)
VKNREIKFRVWDVKNKKFLNPSDIAINGNGNLLITDSGWYENFENQNLSDYVVQQYTGFIDLRGQEIYEGDIFKSQGNRKWDPVEFKNGQWQANLQGVRVFSLYEMFGDDIGTGDYPEVIGNIFETENYKKVYSDDVKPSGKKYNSVSEIMKDLKNGK